MVGYLPLTPTYATWEDQVRNSGFDEWMVQVDAAIVDLCGLTARDLADQPYFDWFDSGLTPEEAAYETLAEEGFPFDA